MGILIDLILIAIIAISAFIGYKKGLVRLAANLFAGILAIILTLILYRPITNTIIKNTNLETKIQEAIIKSANKDIEEQKEITPQTVIEAQSKMVVINQSEEIAKNIISMLTSLILFVAIKIILSIAISLVDSVAHMPILKQFNEVGGLLYGIIRGLVAVIIIVMIMVLITNANQTSKLKNTIEETNLTKIIYEKVDNKINETTKK